MSATRLLFPFTAAILLLGGCVQLQQVETGPMRDEPISIDKGEAERANVELDLGAGELNMRGGAQKLVEGTFDYNVPAWKPVVTSSNNGTHATVTIKQPEHVRVGGNHQYAWNLALNDKVLMDLTLNCGAGQAKLNLGDLNMRSVEVHIGVGQVILDLEGHPTRDYEVNISGGVGQATVNLPKNVGIWAQAQGGLGSIDVSGLEKHGDHYENSLFDNAKVNVRLKVKGGIGEIRIVG